MSTLRTVQAVWPCLKSVERATAWLLWDKQCRCRVGCHSHCFSGDSEAAAHSIFDVVPGRHVRRSLVLLDSAKESSATQDLGMRYDRSEGGAVIRQGGMNGSQDFFIAGER